jgi:hypothetical protein
VGFINTVNYITWWVDERADWATDVHPDDFLRGEPLIWMS